MLEIQKVFLRFAPSLVKNLTAHLAHNICTVLPYISGEWYGRLADGDLFKTVHPRGTTVEWADGQDIAPHELYGD